MDDELKGNGQFRMRMDEPVDDNVIPTQVDELRIEKLSTKVTIISIIIPVLIVVVLVIAYLDMKKRVTYTQDTGTSGFENLSRDMESRFSSLSMRQANLDEMIRKMVAENNKTIARIEVKLKKLGDSLKVQKKSMVSKSLLENKTAGLQQEIGNLVQTVESGNVQVTALTQGLKTEIEHISANASQNDSRMTQISEKLAGLEQEKIDKESLDLALKLELLKLKKSYNTQLDDIQNRIRRIEQRPAPQTPQRAPAPKTPSGANTPQPTSPQPSSGIVEQKIGQ